MEPSSPADGEESDMYVKFEFEQGETLRGNS